MELVRLTPQDIFKLEPCGYLTNGYTLAKIKQIYGDREKLTILEILRQVTSGLKKVPVNDLFWVASKIINKKTLVLWACDCVERCNGIGKQNEDLRSIKAIETTRKYVLGEATLEELEKSTRAVIEVAGFAPSVGAAWATRAVIEAAWAAIEAVQAATRAVIEAARAATRAARAARAATRAAIEGVGAKEQQWQVERLIALIEGE